MSDFAKRFDGIRIGGLKWLGRGSLIAMMCLILAPDAHAYIGPGAGIAAIGTLLGLIGAVLLAVVGFFWYPIKRLLKRNKKAEPEPKTEAEVEQT